LRKAAFKIQLPETSQHVHLLEDSDSFATKTHAEVIASGAATELRSRARFDNGQLKVPFVTRYLSYFDVVRCVHADIMHECENLGKLVSKACLGLAKCNFLRCQKLENRRKRWEGLEDHPYILSEVEVDNIESDINRMRVPRSHGNSLRSFLDPSVYSHLKAHEWKLYLGEIMIYLFRHVSNPVYRKLWIDLCHIFKRTHAYSIATADVKLLRDDIVLWQTEAEILLPTSLSLIVVHYLLHMPDTLDELGPAYTSWMYGNETLNGILTSFSHASHRHEKSIIKKWILFKIAFFHSVHLPDRCGNENRAVALLHSPETWACHWNVCDRKCTSSEYESVLKLLGVESASNLIAVVKNVRNGRKQFSSIPDSDIRSRRRQRENSWHWTMGKCTVHIASPKYAPSQSVNGCTYATIHTIYIYYHANKRYVFFKCCVWESNISNSSCLTEVQKPSFTEFIFVDAADVSNEVCLFVPAGEEARFDHYVVTVNPVF
jgi:hypothetical protein